MKSTYYRAVLILPVALFALALATPMRADGDNEQGGDIEGTEAIDIEMPMTVTAAAPAGSAATVSLESEDDEGTTSVTLTIEGHGLPPGTYNVTGTLKSTGAVVAIGSFSVSEENEFEAEFGSSEGTPFPSGVNPMDLATISITDGNNVVLFTADLTNIPAASSGSIAASVNAVGGALAPQATGHVSLVGTATKGVASGSLTVTGNGLPPRAKLQLAVNDGTVKKVTVDSTGAVNAVVTTKGKSGTIGRGISLFGVKSVKIRDAAGNVALGASL